MAALALALYLTYLLAVFGLRSVLQYRRTGSTGFRGVSGHPGSVEWWGGMLFVVALVLGALGPTLRLFGLTPAIAVLDRDLVHVIGLAGALAGILGTVAAQRAMGASWRVGVDPRETTSLVTTGMFAWVRNPVFTAMQTAGAGLALLAADPITVAAPALLVIAIQIQVRAVEEPYLVHTHGAAYRDYAARAGRFLPGLGRLASPPAGNA